MQHHADSVDTRTSHYPTSDCVIQSRKHPFVYETKCGTPGATQVVHRSLQKVITLGGATTCNRSVEVLALTVPEFTRSLKVERHQIWLHNNENVCYDAIVGRDLLQQLKVNICYPDGTMRMEARIVQIKARDKLLFSTLITQTMIYMRQRFNRLSIPRWTLTW